MMRLLIGLYLSFLIETMLAQTDPAVENASSAKSLEFRCEKIPRDPPDWASLKDTLSSREKLPLRQHWLAHEEPGFLPAFVSAGWGGEYLYLYALLEDRDIFNPLAGFNQPFYAKGDIFEVLIRDPKSERYYEFHVTPHNGIMQLCFPHRGSLAEFRENGGQTENLIETFKIPDLVLETQTEIHPERNQWSVLLKIPARLLKQDPPLGSGDILAFSFCRYDYTRESTTPVLSSTAPYSARSFHRLEEWGTMRLVGE